MSTDLTTYDHDDPYYLEDLAEQIKQEVTLAEDAIYEGLEHAINAGHKLIEAKSLVKHGEWTAWLQTHFDFSPRLARSYMQIARKTADSAVLEAGSIQEALTRIAEPRPALPPGDSETESDEDPEDSPYFTEQEIAPYRAEWVAMSRTVRQAFRAAEGKPDDPTIHPKDMWTMGLMFDFLPVALLELAKRDGVAFDEFQRQHYMTPEWVAKWRRFRSIGRLSLGGKVQALVEAGCVKRHST
jgi:hypothetical protein